MSLRKYLYYLKRVTKAKKGFQTLVNGALRQVKYAAKNSMILQKKLSNWFNHRISLKIRLI